MFYLNIDLRMLPPFATARMFWQRNSGWYENLGFHTDEPAKTKIFYTVYNHAGKDEPFVLLEQMLK